MADDIDLAGNTITFTTAGFTDGGDNLALPAITTPITIMNGTITHSGANGFRFLLVDSGGSLTLNNMTISNGGGTGTSDGGAVRVGGTGNLTVTVSTFLNNTAPDYGGGAILANGSGIVTISDAIFQGNQGGTDGGAIITQLTTSVTIDRTQFLGNVASSASALLVSSSGAATVRNSLFTGNSAAASTISLSSHAET